MPNDASKLNILFVGTLVPLHRINILLDSVILLAQSSNVRIKIVGDGQQAYLIENFIKAHGDILNTNNFVWIREWQSSEQLHEHIESADVCIGILGNSGKSNRVWPFKNYLYMATGRTLVTADTSVARRLDNMSSVQPFITLQDCTGEELANLLTKLSKSRSAIETLASDARLFFDKYLSKSVYQSRLLALLSDDYHMQQ